MTEAPFDEDRAHHWFGVEYNNQAWDIIEADQRSADDIERMIHLAHASTYHWQQVGAPINHVRALQLLTHAYAVAGRGNEAVRYADRCMALAAQVNDELTPWDSACLYGCAAKAYHTAGRSDQAEQFGQQAVDAAQNLTHPNERSLFTKLYRTP